MSELTSNDRLKYTVSYNVAFTKNMGNFQSLKIDLGLSQEGYGGLAKKNEMLANVRQWVEDSLGTAVAEVSAELQGE